MRARPSKANWLPRARSRSPSPTRRRWAGEPGLREVDVTDASPFRRRRPVGWRPGRIVVVKACCLGDGLMATPTLATLGESFPGIEVDVATGAWTRPAFATNRRVRRVLDTEALIGGERPNLKELLRVVTRLRRGRYDAAVVLERGLFLCLLPLLAGIPVRAGFDSGGRGFAHTVPIRVAGVRHEAERYLDCVAELGATRAVRRMEFEPGEEGFVAARRTLRAAGWEGEAYAVLHPGGGENPGMRLTSKRWPPARFAALADRLDADGVRPILVWGRGEVGLGEAVRSAARARVLSVGDGLGLTGLGGLAAGARVYVGNDTGPTHVAVATGTPTVAVFGPSDERRYGPFGEWPDGSPIGQAVAAPSLGPHDPSGAWLSRSTDDVSTDAVWAAVGQVIGRGERWQGAGRSARHV